MSKQVGCGDKTTFWYEEWTCSGILKDIFPQLFKIEKENNCKVVDRLKARNEKNFNGKRAPPWRIIEEIKSQSYLWVKNRGIHLILEDTGRGQSNCRSRLWRSILKWSKQLQVNAMEVIGKARGRRWEHEEPSEMEKKTLEEMRTSEIQEWIQAVNDQNLHGILNDQNTPES
ncbi:hypothetical protein LXL04_035205 [Taraxacum kok-saghyz]